MKFKFNAKSDIKTLKNNAELIENSALKKAILKEFDNEIGGWRNVIEWSKFTKTVIIENQIV